MKERDVYRAEAVRQITAILAAAYMRLRFPGPPWRQVDCSETKSESCDERLTP